MRTIWIALFPVAVAACSREEPRTPPPPLDELYSPIEKRAHAICRAATCWAYDLPPDAPHTDASHLLFHRWWMTSRDAFITMAQHELEDEQRAEEERRRDEAVKKLSAALEQLNRGFELRIPSSGKDFERWLEERGKR